MSLPVYDAAAVRQALTMQQCIELMADVQAALSRGDIRLPLRRALTIPDSTNQLLIMPGSLPAPAVIGVKLVSIFPHNQNAHNLPTIQGQVLLFDAENGTPLALVEAATLTAIRTAAASGAATRELANPEAGCLALLGYGVQAHTHLAAMSTVRPIHEVRIWGPDPDKAHAFAEEHGGDWKIEAAQTPEEALAGADLVCAVSAASDPIIRSDAISPGCHINLVGAHTANAREADSATMARARIFTEISEFALIEAGDILIAMADGAVFESELIEIGAVISGKQPGRLSVDDVTVYKSLGNTAQDLIAAHYVHQSATSNRES